MHLNNLVYLEFKICLLKKLRMSYKRWGVKTFQIYFKNLKRKLKIKKILNQIKIFKYNMMLFMKIIKKNLLMYEKECFYV